MSSPTGIVLGVVGSGKTTLYNKVCDKSEKADNDVESATRHLHIHTVTWGNRSFTLIDTPGTETTKLVYEHSYVIKGGLTIQPLNTIFVLCPYEPRCRDTMIQNFYGQVQMIKEEYRSMCVPIVTKMDHFVASMKIPDISTMRNIITDIFKDDTGVDRVLFTELHSNPHDIATDMHNCMKDMPQMKLEYSDEDFLMYFNVAEFRGRMKMKVIDLERKIKGICNGFVEALEEMEEDPNIPKMGDERNGIIMDAISQNLMELNEIVDAFIEQDGDQMHTLDSYTAYIDLQKIILNQHNDFRDRAKALLTYDPDDANDWRNCVRKCEHCGEIWVKVEGCDDATTCGAIPSSGDSITSSFRYILRKVNKKFRFVHSSEFSQRKAPKYCPKNATKQMGCGKQIVWKNQPRVPESELNKLFTTKDLESVIMQFRTRQDFTSRMKFRDCSIPLFDKKEWYK